MLSFFKILILVTVGYLLYNLVRFVMFLGRSSRDARKKMEEARKGQSQNQNARSGSGQNKIIELDKDQYHVD